MTTPYSTKPERSFWRPAVASRSFFDLEELWHPRFDIQTTDPIVTFGSCFAQHIGRALVERGFSWYSAEPAPPGLSTANARLFNYDVFSARTGNIYTTSMLLQLTRWATGAAEIPAAVWEKDGRIYDPFRPAIEPNGFKTNQEMLANRKNSVAAFRECMKVAKYFVFTLGLTESWFDRAGGYEYAICPGTAAGEFDADRHIFKNQTVGEIQADLIEAIDLMREVNPALHFILTVSPVPLVATNSENHVLVATMESKSILRAVAGQVARERGEVDYFPSYELINSPVIRGTFFEPNQRSVNSQGVAFVMSKFFEGLVEAGGSLGTREKTNPARPPLSTIEQRSARTDLVCEEELLQAFEGAS